MEEINKIVELVSGAVGDKSLSYDDYKLLLLKSGIAEDNLYGFFAYTDDGVSGLIVGISKSNLKKKLVKYFLCYFQ
ncbi:MAG TPA: hypothetical protein VK254_00785 [Candidatus Bathyarchaeia archaeon]|nr:hypothetical protein [Candidatus Bathyarchaeia archaeon]